VNQTPTEQLLVKTSALQNAIFGRAQPQKVFSLASDWYWEQDATGEFTTVSGPVVELPGLRVTAFFGRQSEGQIAGWNNSQRLLLQEKIAARQPFPDFRFDRMGPDGVLQNFRVSGEPIFSPSCRFAGFCGVGVEMTERKQEPDRVPSAAA
jgi:hypothetical protein